MEKLLEEEFGVPVEVISLGEMEEKEEKKKELDEDTMSALSEVLKDETAVKSLIGTVILDTKVPSIENLLRYPDGLKVLKEAQRLTKLDTLPKEHIPQVIRKRAKGERFLVPVETETEYIQMDLVEVAEREAFRRLSERYTEKMLEKIFCYYEQNALGKAGMVRLDSILDDTTMGLVRYLLESPRMRQVYGLNRHGYFSNQNYKKLFLVGSYMTMKELQMLEKEMDYIWLNGIAENSQEMRTLRVNCTRAIAEYLVLRFPEKYLVDEKGHHVWKKKMKGIVRREDVKTIADNLPASVGRLMKGTGPRVKEYSLRNVYEHLKAMYSIKGAEER